MSILKQYKIALTFLPHLGPVIVKRLVAQVGSVEGVFKEKKANLKKVEGIGTHIIENLNFNNALQKAEKQLEYVKKLDLNVLFYLDDDYPLRLLDCVDSPILLYVKGECDFNASKVVSIVGTRNATDYGRECSTNLVKEISTQYSETLIVSGLAYGIDISAHKAALKYNLPTVGVLGHSLDKIYPSIHNKYAREIVEKNGSLISEFPIGSEFLQSNFVQRNRIIAGMSDATIVVESGEKGGALITATMANAYNREVFAFPGKTKDHFSMGCNKLIKKNAARLIESVKDLEYVLGWEPKAKTKQVVQKKLLIALTADEQIIYDAIKGKESVHIDEICLNFNIPMNKASALLLKLEFDGIIKSLPGKNYTLV